MPVGFQWDYKASYIKQIFVRCKLDCIKNLTWKYLASVMKNESIYLPTIVNIITGNNILLLLTGLVP